jgi:hypothetical protein
MTLVQRRIRSTTIAVAVAFAIGASPAYAQAGSPRPYRALFKGASSAADQGNLVFSVNFAEAYDDNLQAELAGGAGTSVYQASGFYSVLSPAVTYASRGERRRVQFGLSAASNVRYYGDLHEILVTSHSAGIGVSAQLARGTALFINQSASYAPAYLYGLFANLAAPAVGDGIAPASDYQVNAERSYAFATAASLSQKLSTHSTVSFNSDVRYTDFVGRAPGFVNMYGYDAGGRWTYASSENIKMRLGYAYRDTQYSGVQRIGEQNLDIGVDYTRPLSRTRRATVGFSLTPTSANVPVQASDSRRQQYLLGADAYLDYQIGRTWDARGTIHRGVGYVAGLSNPVFSNAFSVATQGFLNTRIDVLASGAYTAGQTALVGNSTSFTTYTGDARLRFATSRLLAMYVEYIYYFYRFDRTALLPGVPSGLTRNGVRVGLTLWVPVREK